MLVATRLRLIPNKTQEEWLRKNVGVARFIYNFSLSMKETAYKEQGIILGQKEIMRQITDMKYTTDSTFGICRHWWSNLSVAM